MPSFPLLNMFGRQLTKMSIVTSFPISFLLVGLQAIVDVKFSCPCKADRNKAISAFIFIVPALFAFVIMFVLLRPCQYKCRCKKQNNTETSQGKDTKETSQGQDNSETSQGKDTKETSQGQDNSETSLEKAVVVCCIPGIVWICICFIDGDYFACGLTNWTGRYACDKELHPNCLNWCKPTELSPEEYETEYYEKTRELIFTSKIIGYILAIIFCIIAIIWVSWETAETKKKDVASPMSNAKSADETARLLSGNLAETKTVTKDRASPTNIQMSNTKSADEAARLLSGNLAETKTVTKDRASPTNIQMSNTKSADEAASLLKT
ncbi:uncharacterized protein LOC127524571 [Ctenopharyngodon idella]|uniref:uncharacterized protein LOC127524571 n=1 Tax=Ctenopharyngodon idella TaxID=7959 RepID=UPI00222F0468|nr:uncharacterized protein LOC127524571 [Ctenopharyngodon idella]